MGVFDWAGLMLKLRDSHITSEVKQALADLREDYQKLREENFELREQMQAARRRRDLVFDAGVYWEKYESGDNVRRVAVCPHCHDSESKIIRMKPEDPGDWFCTVCRNRFYAKQPQT